MKINHDVTFIHSFLNNCGSNEKGTQGDAWRLSPRNSEKERKIFSKLETERNFLNFIKGMHEKPTANINVKI